MYVSYEKIFKTIWKCNIIITGATKTTVLVSRPGVDSRS